MATEWHQISPQGFCYVQVQAMIKQDFTSYFGWQGSNQSEVSIMIAKTGLVPLCNIALLFCHDISDQEIEGSIVPKVDKPYFKDVASMSQMVYMFP